MKTNQPANATELRRHAEQRLQTREQTPQSTIRNPQSAQRLVHELQVHQIELEMQNEELRRMSARAGVLTAQYFDLYEFAPTGYVTLDPEGVIRQVNLAGARLLGVGRSQLVNRRLGLFVAGGDRRAFSDFLQRVFASQAKECCEVTLPQAGSHLLSLRIEGTRSTEGQECRAVLFDVTERQQAEAALLIAHTQQTLLGEMLQVSLEHTPLELKLVKVLDLLFAVPELSLERKGAIFLMEADTLVMKAQRNLPAAILTSCARLPLGKCLCGRAAASGQIEFCDDLDERHAIRYDGMQPHGHYCVPIRSRDKTSGVITLHVAHGCKREQRAERFLTAVADALAVMIERQRTENAMQESEEQFRAMFEMASIGMGQADPQSGQFLRVNQKLCAITGYSAAELLGMRISEITHPDDRQQDREEFQRVVRGEAPDYHLEKRYVRKDGAVIWVSANMTVIRDAAGQPVRTMATIEDITERKALEEQLRQSQKMEAVGQLAGGVAHDFNNMLAVIRGNAELLLMDEAQYTAEAKVGLEHVVEASERAANLTRQLLTFSRKQVMQPQPLLLNEVIANLTKMLNRVISENIDLQCHYAALLPHVQADTGMMEQVILNLVINARDAMPEGGQLRVATEQVVLDEAHARANPGACAGEFVCLLVSDSGTGIAPEVLPRIFEPFFTTKDVGKGTGLGLATVYGIVRQHQGWIEVSSQVGEGSTFKVFLPAIPTPAGLAPAAEAEAEIRGGNETILLVEDEHTVRVTTRRLLESKGYRIREATNGREALEVWQSHAGEIALLLTDIIMPGEMTGRDLAEQLWGQRPALKVIFMSGYSADVLVKGTDYIRRTKSRFLQKPSSSQVILETVRRTLDEKEPVAAPGEGGSIQ